MKKIAVILSGCGYLDGAEINESVLTLLALDKAGASYQCFAPDMPQLHVVNHITGEPMDCEPRNVMIEAARIARGKIQPLSQARVEDFDGLILPGGFGVAKNLSDFASAGADMTILPALEALCKAFAAAGKPAGYICIAPTLAARIYGDQVRCTIGDEAGVAQAITQMGGQHVECAVDKAVADPLHKVVTTPAYMSAQRISQAAAGIERLVQQVLSMA